MLYRLRLWWAKRHMTVCTCKNTDLAPPFHFDNCAVKQEWRENERKKVA